MSFDASDDLRHRPPPGQKSRDSLFWNLILPEHDVGLQVYTWVNERGEAGRQVAVFGPGAKPLALDVRAGIKVGAKADFDDWRLEGLAVRQPEPLRTVELRFESADVALEYQFTALHEPFSYTANPAGCPQWMATDRFEQTGRVQGEFKLDGRRIPFDTLAHRDHSWGRRNWRFPHHWKWLAAQSASGKAFNAMFWIARGELGVNGYVLRDGKPVALVDGRAQAEYDADMTQRRLTAELVDESGAVTKVTADRYAVVRMPFGSDSEVLEAACRFTIDGEEGAGQFEALWPASYLAQLVGDES